MSRSFRFAVGAGLVASVVGLAAAPVAAQPSGNPRPVAPAQRGTAIGGTLGKHFHVSNPRVVRGPTGPVLVLDLVARGNFVAPNFTAQMRVFAPSPDGFGEILFPTADVFIGPHAVWRTGQQGRAFVPLFVLPGTRLESILIGESPF